MSWNHRVMRHTHTNKGTGEIEIWLAIHEVHYRDKEVDDLAVAASETGYTADPVAVTAADIDGLKWTLEQMLAALNKPILEYT